MNLLLYQSLRRESGFRVLMVKVEQGGELGDAGSAMRFPEVQHDDLPVVAGQVHCTCSIRNGEVWSGFASLLGMVAAITGGEGKHQ